ncbi:MAG TPA: hypothetical protein PKH51_01165 [Candidatus Sumerlaeota bacterium]|nr:hypothetical protein [Candidatus Sumerlaeota bacterium]
MVVKFRNILIAAVMVCTVTTLLHADLWALQTDGVLPTMTPQPTPSPTPTITEVPPDASRPCFAGAYYRKAVSSIDDWDGIEGEVTLPEIEFDPDRWDTTRGRYLDNPSVYMGGRAGSQEIDCGLTWSQTRDEQGYISTEGRAFRPFWRNDAWHNAPLDPALYFHPGDKVRMRCAVTTNGKMELVVTLVSRKATGVPATAPLPFRAEFDAASFGPGELQEFKRVNAIDQVGNEGRPVVPTNTVVFDAKWENVVLIRNGQRLPFNGQRFTDMRCPTPSKVAVTAVQNDESGEMITIDGSK